MSKWLFVWSSMEFILNIVGVGLHIRKGTWGKSKSVIGSEKSSDEGFSFRFINFSSSVIVVFSPEVIEVSGYICVNFILLDDMESSNNVSSPLWSRWFWEFPDTSSSTKWISLFNSVSLEYVVHDVVFISTIAFIW